VAAKNCLVELERGHGGRDGLLDVREVSDRLLDVDRIVVVVGVLVTGHDMLCTKALDCPQRGDPLRAGGRVGLGEIHVGVVVDDVSGHDELRVGNPQDAGACCVGVSGLDHPQLMAFEEDVVAVDFLGNDRGRDLSREKAAPEPLAVVVPRLDARARNPSGGRDGPRPREGVEKLPDPVDVVAVSVREVDVRQIPLVLLDPVDQDLVLLDRREGVDEYRIALPEDQSRGVGHPAQVLVVTFREVTGKSLAAREEGVVRQVCHVVSLDSVDVTKIVTSDRRDRNPAPHIAVMSEGP